MQEKLKIVYLKKDQLQCLEGNPRKVLDKDGIEKLKILIKEHGFQNPLQVYQEENKKYTILCGNHRFKAALELDFNEFPCIVYKGDRKKAIARAVSDNKSNEWTEWELPLLKDILEDLDTGEFDINAVTGFTEDDIESLMLQFHLEDEEEENKRANTVSEIDESNIICKEGDLWLLGEHRLLCGDCIEKENIDKLLVGKKVDIAIYDPPYGVSYANKNKFLNKIDKGNRIQKEIKNDHQNEKDIQEFWKQIFEITRDNLNETNSYYIFGPQIQGMMMMMMMEAALPYRHVIIWVKNNHVLGRCDYNYKHEPLFFGWTTKHKFYGNGKFKTSVWEVDKPHKSDLHPTMKPIELMENALLNSSQKNDTCFDPFLGSGSTLIACEKTNRKCYGLEIDPYYCDIILKRWEDYAGKDAIRESDGKKRIELIKV